MGDVKETIKKEIASLLYEKTVIGDVSPESLLGRVDRDLGIDAFLEALFDGHYIKECRNCKRLFIAKDKRCLYCSRPVSGGRTCKEVGPTKARNNDPVTKAFDSARRLHLKRRAARNKTEAACHDYNEWLSYAKLQEGACRAGSIDLETFRERIGANYRKTHLAEESGNDD